MVVAEFYQQIRSKFNYLFSGELSKGSIQAILVNVLGAGLALLLQIVLARFLGVTEFGIYSYFISWVSILVLIATFGFDLSVVKFIPGYLSSKDFASLKGIVFFSVIITTLVSVCLSVLFYILCRELIVIDQSEGVLFVAMCLLPVLALSNIRQGIVRGFKQIALSRAPDVVLRPALMILGMLVLSFVGKGFLSAYTAIVVQIFSCLLAFGFGSYLFFRKNKNIHWRIKSSIHTPDWIKTSIPLMLISGMYIILNEVDKIMLGLLASPAEVGIYSAAAKISLLTLFGLQAVNTIAAPLIAETYTNDVERLQLLASKISLGIFIISLPIVLSILLFGRSILTVFGTEFAPGYAPLLLLLIGQIVNFSVGPVGFLMTMTNYQRQSLGVLTVTLLGNIVLNVPAIYFGGMYGAALVTMVAIIFRNIVLHHKVKKYLHVDASIYFALKNKFSKTG